jgi:flagellar biosynthesis/type III secretory pathway M-ring protein FliF/YscJ
VADAPLTGVAAVLTQAKELWAKQSRGRKAIAVAALLGIAGVVAVSTLSHRTEPWAAIAEGVSPDDAHELLAVLQSRQLPVRLRDGKVEVAIERLEEARAIAASAGIPRTGKGLELFDN